MKKILCFMLVFTLLSLALVGCGQQEQPEEAAGPGETNEDKEFVIGFSIDDLRLERWQHDRDYFVQEAEKLGATVLVQSANGDAQLQYSQCENLISQGIDLLVVIANNGEVMGPIVEEAHANGIKVLAYDRLIMNSDLDMYISFDNVKVGELQAQAIVEEVPAGNYFLMGGSPTDNNAKLFREGQMNVIQPYVDGGDITIVGDQWAKDWLPEEALVIMENGLTANNNKVDAVVASNDSTAGGAVQALTAQGLDGKVAISGQDADLAACQRIVEGTQTMTVYKPIKNLATESARLSMKMIKGDSITPDSKVNNGQKDVDSILLTPVSVNKDNMADTIIKDGFHKVEDVYKNLPQDQWPQ